jgi:hypothetical protein
MNRSMTLNMMKRPLLIALAATFARRMRKQRPRR